MRRGGGHAANQRARLHVTNRASLSKNLRGSLLPGGFLHHHHPPTPQLTPSPLRRLRASSSSQCWLDRLCGRRAPSALQPAMLPAEPLRYDTRSSHCTPQLRRALAIPSRNFTRCCEALSVQLIWLLTHWLPQRSASTSSSTAEEAASSWKTNALPAGATAFAIGTVAWYYHLYGRNVDAMTPAEEG